MSKNERTDFAAIMEAKRKTREDAIEHLRAEAKSRGQMSDRAFWAMVYDFEMAPMTTNRRQLKELGIDCPTCTNDLTELAEDEIGASLRSIVDGLAGLNIYLLHTDHLSDRALLAKLVAEIIDEDVRDLPPDGAAKEFIDLCIPETDEEWATFEAHYGDAANKERAWNRDATLPRPDGSQMR